MNLEDIFYLASTNSVAILTPAELDKKLEDWQLDVSSLQKLNESLGQLKAISIEVLRMPIEKVCHKTLFMGMVKRIKREKSLTQVTIRKLDEAMYEIERETNPVELHKLLLAPLKEVVGYQARRGSWSKPYQVHAFETALATMDARMTNAQPQTNNGGGESQNKRSRVRNLDKTTNRIRTRIIQDRKDRTGDAVSHVTGTDLGTEVTGHSPETDALPRWHLGQIINRT